MVDGLEILVAQGAASFERWTGMDGSPQGDAGGHHDIAKSMNPPTQTGAAPSKPATGHHHAVAAWRLRPRAHGRPRRPRVRRARGRWTTRSRRRHRAGSARRSACCVDDGAITDDQLARAVAERFGLDHVDLAHLPRRPRRRQARHPRRGQAATRPCPVSFVGDRTLLVAMADPANVLAVDDIAVMTGYEVRPAVASLDRHRVAARAPRGPRLRQRRHCVDLDDEERGRGRRRRAAAPAGARAAPLYDIREQDRRSTSAPRGEDASVIQLVHRVIKEAVERGVSDIHFEPQRRGDARPLPHRRRAPARPRSVPRSAGPGGRLAREDPLRPRHRRAPDPAGRPHLARGRRQADRPPRRDAARRATARTSSCESSTSRKVMIELETARHAAAGARALHEGVRRRRTAPCS